jgi:hypothetical protein
MEVVRWRLFCQRHWHFRSLSRSRQGKQDWNRLALEVHIHVEVVDHAFNNEE